MRHSKLALVGTRERRPSMYQYTPEDSILPSLAGVAYKDPKGLKYIPGHQTYTIYIPESNHFFNLGLIIYVTTKLDSGLDVEETISTLNCIIADTQTYKEEIESKIYHEI